MLPLRVPRHGSVGGRPGPQIGGTSYALRSPAAFASWGLAPAAEAAHAVGIGTDSRACDGGDDVLGVGPTPSGRSYSRGSLLVEVRMARGLRDVHALGTQEPYVLAKLCGVGGGSMSHRTRPCAGGGTHPRWSTSHNNRMVFDLRDATRLSRAQARARAKAGEPSKPERPLTLSFELWYASCLFAVPLLVCLFTDIMN